MNNNHYAILLNANAIASDLLNRKDLFSFKLQMDTLDFVLWGVGESPEDAQKDVYQNLKEAKCLIEVKCDSNVSALINKVGGQEAMKHLWVNDKNELQLLPDHQTLLNFSRRHALPDEAFHELCTLFEELKKS